jgi:hypothetical protein
MHSHYYLGKTTIDDGHWHNYEGMTSCDANTPNHIHYMDGKTSLDCDHSHDYHNATGPAIYIGGKHYHMYCAITKVADGHVHKYEDATDKYSDSFYKKCPPCSEPCKK